MVNADSEREAHAMLSARGVAAYELRAHHGRSVGFRLNQGVTKKELARYLKQLATLLRARVPLLDALGTLARSKSHPILAERNRLILADVRAGKRLSAALGERLPECPGYVERLADLGEATGALAEALGDAVDRIEYELQVQAEVRSALAYPIFLALTGAVVILLMFAFVVPRFADMLGSDFSAAPPISRLVLGFGLWIQSNGVFFLGLILCTVIVAVVLSRNSAMASKVRAQVRRWPIVGAMLERSDQAGWCRTVGVALSHKAQLVDALRLGESGAPGSDFRKGLETVRQKVRAGRPLDEALAGAELNFDPMIIDLIHTGRNAGVLDEMLLFAADLLDKEARERTKQVTALAEPVAIVSVALVVGFVVVSIVLAMTSMYNFEF
ncbi:MAG: type II secretion system F family protein [Pseudomonadota bacterium]